MKHALLTKYACHLGTTLIDAEADQLTIDKEAEPSTFVVENYLVEVDPDHAPLSRGSAGVHFIRRYDSEDVMPIRDVWTFIAFEVPFSEYAP